MNEQDVSPTLPVEASRCLDELLDYWSAMRRLSPQQVQALRQGIRLEQLSVSWWREYWQELGVLVARSVVAYDRALPIMKPRSGTRDSLYRPYLRIGAASGKEAMSRE
jgi:hypothetical protein